MNPLAFAIHLLNLFAPALGVALLLVLASHVFMRKAAQGRGWLAPAAINFVVGSAVLAGGLALSGRDGRMLTYGALAVACATSQWLWLRAWRA
ncbi:hypothetical protein [Pulveribacter suum]|uniref:Uncharacterized protein n=1 Tax=Pulveribacter suum TaxID=2116657 RepID=A0A2P1NNI2_9BURK|nr:hypothetical protein [Pulveribacter suum]AVP58624.1 hypothetical protein C7H73_13760 [Pulveribacter suum]